MKTVAELYASLRQETSRIVVGQEEALRLILISLVSEGHVLLEGVPGVAKTTLARAVAASLGLRFRRVQFTPDLMPSDILGTPIFQFQENRFHIVEGPVFTNILLADEINRAPSKTQSALLEAMQERQVSLEGTARPLPSPFLVLATQNPVEHEGTYPLPEAQLDRFLFKIRLDYPSLEDEIRILDQHRGDSAGFTGLLESIRPIAGPEELRQAKEQALRVRVEPSLQRYIVELVRRSREHVHLQLGASPRASLLLLVAARACAALEGRDFLIPDDVKGLFLPAMRHRVVGTAAAEVEGIGADVILREILDAVPVPR